MPSLSLSGTQTIVTALPASLITIILPCSPASPHNLEDVFHSLLQNATTLIIKYMMCRSFSFIFSSPRPSLQPLVFSASPRFICSCVLPLSLCKTRNSDITELGTLTMKLKKRRFQLQGGVRVFKFIGWMLLEQSILGLGISHHVGIVGAVWGATPPLSLSTSQTHIHTPLRVVIERLVAIHPIPARWETHLKRWCVCLLYYIPMHILGRVTCSRVAEMCLAMGKAAKKKIVLDSFKITHRNNPISV